MAKNVSVQFIITTNSTPSLFLSFIGEKLPQQLKKGGGGGREGGRGGRGGGGGGQRRGGRRRRRFLSPLKDFPDTLPTLPVEYPSFAPEPGDY